MLEVSNEVQGNNDSMTESVTDPFDVARLRTGFSPGARILVTGAGGLLGRVLIERLIECDNVRLITAVDPRLRRPEGGISYGKVRYISERIQDCAPRFLSERFDTIFHFGEFARIAESFIQPETVLENNISATIAIAGLWRRMNCVLCFAASSSEFSGLKGAVAEDIALSPYTLSKSFGSSLVRSFGHWFDLRFKCIYFYNVYGALPEEEADGTVVSEYLRARKNGAPLRVSLPGTQRRVFTHVADAVDGVFFALSEGRFGDFHVGSSEALSLLELAEIFDGDVEFVEAPISIRDVADVFRPDLLPVGWKAKRNLRDFVLSIIFQDSA